MLKIAVFRGSFNPPHIGHAMAIQWFLWSGNADRVLLVPPVLQGDGDRDERLVVNRPVRRPPDKKLAPLYIRLQLLHALIDDIGNDAVTVSSLQITDDDPYNLLTHLARKHTGSKIRLAMGADSLLNVGSWSNWVNIANNFDPIIVGRERHPNPQDTPILPGYSSTEIRRRISDAKPWHHLVTPRVRDLLPGPYWEKW